MACIFVKVFPKSVQVICLQSHSQPVQPSSKGPPALSAAHPQLSLPLATPCHPDWLGSPGKVTWHLWAYFFSESAEFIHVTCLAQCQLWLHLITYYCYS